MKKSIALSACAIVALAGTSAGAQVIDWASPIDGNWNNAGNWIGANVPNTAGEDAVLGLVGAYTVDSTLNYTIGALSITNPLATLTLGSGRTFTLSTSLLNEGTIIINPTGSGFNAHLSLSSGAPIGGTGSILLNAVSNPANAQIVCNGLPAWNYFGHTIHGSGQITGSMQNDSDIVADDPSGAGLRISGTLGQTTNGRLIADAGTVFLGNGSVIIGGEITSLSGGKVRVQTSATAIAVTNSGDLGIPGQGWSLLIEDFIENNGTITVNSNNSSFNAHLRFNTVSALLKGTGNVVMVSMGDLADAQLLTNGAYTGTIGANQTVEGSGLITGANGGTIFNSGTINGNDPTVGLGLAGNLDGGGMYRSDNGLLILRNGLFLNGGTFDTTGTGLVDMTSNGLVMLSNVTNLGQMGIQGQGGTIGLAGLMVNNGTITVNSNNSSFNAHLRFETNVAIGGSGTVHMVSMGDLGDAQLFTNGAVDGTIGFEQTVDGSGIVDGRSGGTISNNGTINGNHAAVDPDPVRILELRGNHNGNTVGVYRSDDGILALGNGLFLQNGIFDSSGVGIVDMTNNGVATLSDVVNLGQMGIRGQGGTIALTGLMTNDGTITVNSNMNGFNAHLRMDNALAAINGTGTVRMQVASGDLGDAQLYTNGAHNGTIGMNQLVAGSGLIDGRNGGTIVNHGMISGDDPLYALELRGNHFGDSIGIYNANNGVLALTNGLVLDYGILSSSGTGIVDMTTGGIVTLSRITNTGTMGIRGQGGTIALTDYFTNNGTIRINSNSNGFNAYLRFDAATVIDGNGTIEMFVNSDLGDAQILNNQGFVGTIGDGQTIAGSGRLQGEMNMDGTLDPGSTHRRFDIDTLHLSASSAMIADLGGLLAGEFDRLLLGNSDTINLDGSLMVNLDAGYTPVFGDTWDIIDGGTIAGTFATEQVPNAPIGQVYRVIYESDRVFVILTCDADYTGDGVLNFFDVSKFLTLFSDQDPDADINGDGNFNFFDISAFLQIFSVPCE